MDINDVKIMVGNKVYPAQNLNWIQTPHDYPRIEVEACISPYNYSGFSTRYARPTPATPTIANVIFNPPATIIFWSDKTKTVVKCDCEQEAYDPEKGIAMAIAKKLMGENKYEYYNTFLHWLKKYDKQIKQENTRTDISLTFASDTEVEEILREIYRTDI